MMRAVAASSAVTRDGDETWTDDMGFSSVDMSDWSARRAKPVTCARNAASVRSAIRSRSVRSKAKAGSAARAASSAEASVRCMPQRGEPRVLAGVDPFDRRHAGFPSHQQMLGRCVEVDGGLTGEVGLVHLPDAQRRMRRAQQATRRVERRTAVAASRSAGVAASAASRVSGGSTSSAARRASSIAHSSRATSAR